jgi:type II secretory pathway pseudopilin PulG
MNCLKELNMTRYSKSLNPAQPPARSPVQVCKQTRPRTTDGHRAFSLIEMIGVLAVGIILALALATITIRQLDRVASDKETKQLKAFAEVFKQSVLKTKSIPDQTGWDQMIATNAGLQLGSVQTNDRRLARVYLLDPSFRVGTGGGALPPYTQGITGSSIQPSNTWRLMILSSLSKALPVASGATNTPTTFNNIWNAAEGALPAGVPWTVGGVAWGKGEDLKVQRMDLAELFVRLFLNNTMTNTLANYSIDGVAASVPVTNLFGGYFLDGSQLGLYDPTNASSFRYNEILHSSKSFDFVLGSWRSDRFLGRTIQHPDGVDLQVAVNVFLNDCIDNPHTKASATRQAVYASMLSYITNFVLWRDSNPSYANGYCCGSGTLLYNSQVDLATKSVNLINK